MARATTSSLNAHKSSIDPPPRPTMRTSMSFIRFICFTASAISWAAPSPCTFTGCNKTETFRFRLWMMLRMSRTAAPVGEVITPTFQGNSGIAFFFSSANRPSAVSLTFNCSNAFCNAPSPRGSICSTINWYSPRAS